MKYIAALMLMASLAFADVAPRLLTTNGDTRLSVVELVATAEGTKPFKLQWYRNGAIVPGATADVIRITDPKETGGFHCTITNAAGSTQTGIVKFANTYVEAAPDVLVTRKQSK